MCKKQLWKSITLRKGAGHLPTPFTQNNTFPHMFFAHFAGLNELLDFSAKGKLAVMV